MDGQAIKSGIIFVRERMTPDRQVIKSRKGACQSDTNSIASLVRSRASYRRDRSIDRSIDPNPRSTDPSSPRLRHLSAWRNHRHLLPVLSRQDNLLPRSNRSTIISRPSACRQRISTEGTGQPRNTVRDIYSSRRISSDRICEPRRSWRCLATRRSHREERIADRRTRKTNRLPIYLLGWFSMMYAVEGILALRYRKIFGSVFMARYYDEYSMNCYFSI